jgi:hypothetical protein
MRTSTNSIILAALLGIYLVAPPPAVKPCNSGGGGNFNGNGNSGSFNGNGNSNSFNGNGNSDNFNGNGPGFMPDYLLQQLLRESGRQLIRCQPRRKVRDN